MRLRKVSALIWILSASAVLAVYMGSLAPAAVLAQQETGSVATVTGTPGGPVITVTYPEQINVRSGPSTYIYPAIGVLLPGETAPALGRSPGGEWIVIAYAGVPGGIGWVYAQLVSLTPGFLAIIEPPPTPTPQTTPTINPTLVAAFVIPATPTRLPTFTAPPPLFVPTYIAQTSAPARSGGVPMGLIIFSLGVIGLFGAVISFLRGR